MKVVLVNTWENSGGAAVACNRLFYAYKKKGIDVKYLVLGKTSKDSHVIELPQSRFWKKIYSSTFYLEQAILKLIKKQHVDYSLITFGLKLSRYKQVQEADIIHLHWIHNSFIDIQDLNTLIEKGKKVYWTMHDMWAFTGGCHYAGACNQYLTECKSCIALKNSNFDFLTKYQYQIKNKLKLEKIKFITPSQWLCDIAKQSHLLKSSAIKAIPNTIDVENFKPIDKSTALNILNVNLDHRLKTLLFVSMNTKDPRKGFNELKKAIIQYCNTSKETTQLIIIGRSEIDQELDSLTNLKIHRLGRISDMKIIAAAYSYADVFLIPSNQDNLPNTVLESLSCGTGVVAFNVGGIPEMVKHKSTGYLVTQFDILEFSNGIKWCFENKEVLNNNCREWVMKNYTNEIIIDKHIQYYNSI